MFRVELPGPKISKAASTDDVRVTVEMPRSHFNALAERGQVRDYRQAYEEGHIRVSGDSGIQKLIAQVIQRHEERGRTKQVHSRVGRSVDPLGLARLRAATQLIHRPVAARDPAGIARSIGGAQAQDVYAGPQTFRSRSRTLTAADITRARTLERSLLRTWVMRETIHMIPTEDAAWWLPVFEPAMERWTRRRLGQLGMPAGPVERALRLIAGMRESDGPLTRSEF